MIILYRKNGGEVLGASTDVTAYAGVDNTFFGTVTDPPFPQGSDLSIPKIYDTAQVRNATAQEQATFVTAAATDDNLQQRVSALNLANNNPIQRKILMAIVSVLLDEINTLRTTAGLGTRSMNQAKTAIQNKINSGSVD
jgi:hypothetical protein